ncbi:DNA polymerase I [Christensenellaceae bacterium OttesenSCG-928-K19]|nr:DNA polymerase I [Christensenellaceae bacterium OttesenSCG-928-K19]
MTEGTLLAIDGNSLMHRAYWALPQMSDVEGRPVNAVYGFFNMLFNIVDEYKPTHIAVAFDMHEKTFRHKQYAEYKAGRQKTPEDLNEQFGILKDALTMVGIRYVEKAGYEADDILGTLVKNAEMQAYIFTGDKDELQLISDTTCVVLTKKGVSETALMTEQALKDEKGITPQQVTDLKGLMGDASDNIPGVAGVGEKTALKLLHEYDTVENLYNNLEQLPKNKLLEKLQNGRESAFQSKELATIYTDVPLEEKMTDFSFGGFESDKLESMFHKYGFRNFMKRFSLSTEARKTTESREIHPEEVDIFDDAVEVAFLLLDNRISIAIDGDTEYFIPLKMNLLDEGYDLAEGLRALKMFLKGKRLVTHDVKAFMHNYPDFEVYDFHDVMLTDWVLSPSHSKYDLSSMMKRADMEMNAACLFSLYEKQQDEIEKNELEFILYDVEFPLLKVLFCMEENGFCVSRDELAALGEKYNLQIKKLTQNIYELAGMEFNISSTKQLAEVLFERLELPVIKKTKTGYSTDVEVLEKLEGKHPIIGYIMEYRTLTKLKGTYIDGLLTLIKDGYIHTTFLQTATATGRLSSVEPNLQNIPIKSAMADEIREAFVAPDKAVIVSADYSQIELRILAHMADDENLKQAFWDNEDIHARTAAEILDKDIDDVTKAERAHAKAVNFGIVYGISDFGLARNTVLSRKQAALYIDRYLEEFAGVRRYMEDIKEEAHRQGFVRTMFGRIRYIPELTSGNYNIRSAGERAALNTPIQGTAADIIKIAMNKVAEKLNGMTSKLVLQVHDELIVYADAEEADDVKTLLKECMEGAAQLSVPLVANVASGKNWLEAK